MKLIVIASLALLAASVHAAPGGYIGMGGVYKPNPEKMPDYMDAAKHAGKMAWNQQLDSEVGALPNVNRGERRAQIKNPVFYTNVPAQPVQHVVVPQQQFVHGFQPIFRY